MENDLKTKILSAIDLLNNPDQVKRKAAEVFLNEADPSNQPFFSTLLLLTADASVTEIQRIQAILVLKMFVTRKWADFPEPTKGLFKQNLLDAICEAKSLKTGKLLSEVLYPVVVKTFPEHWETLDSDLLNRIQQNLNNSDKLYFLLLAYLKLAKSMEIDNSNTLRTENITETFFPILEELFSSLLGTELSVQNLAFISLLIKIFYRSHRFRLTNYIKADAKCSLWMNYFLAVMNSKDKRLSNAKKWVAKTMIYFFRNYFYVSGPEVNKQVCPNFLNYWSVTWGFKFVEAFSDFLYTYNISDKEDRVVFNISRNFFYIPKNQKILENYKESLSKLFEVSLFKMSLLTEDDIETYKNDPSEYFKKNDDLAFERSLRESATNIVNSLAQNGFYNNLINIITAKMTANPSIIEKENCYYYIQKLKNRIIKDTDNSIASIEKLFSDFILPDGKHEIGILRTRVVILIEQFCGHFQDPNIVRRTVELVTERLEDPDMPVRSFAAIAMERLLAKPEVVDMVRPHVKKVLLIFVNIISECDHERLVNSLTGIFESYNQEIGPYVLDLVATLKNLILKLYKRSEDENVEDVEESEFSILSSYTAIKELLKANFDRTALPNVYAQIEELIFQALGDHDLEVVEEILDLVNMLVFRSEKNNVLPGLWNFFEFLCYATELNLPLPAAPCQNPFLSILHNNRQNFKEFASAILRCYRNFIHVGGDSLLTLQDQNGYFYIDLLMKSIDSCRHYESEILEDSLLAETSMFDAILLFAYKDNPSVVQGKGLMTNCAKRTLQMPVNGPSYPRLYDNARIHNLGILCASFFEQTKEAFNINSDFVNNWLGLHIGALTYRVRKASLLGLLTLLRNHGAVEGLSAALNVFVPVLLKELVVLKLQKKHEEKCDYDLDDLSNLDDEGDQVAFDLSASLTETTLEQIEKRIQVNDGKYMMETETLLNFDWDFVLEELQSVDVGRVAKEVFMGLEKERNGFINGLINGFAKEIGEEIQKELA